MVKIRLSVLVLAVVLTAAAPGRARAQHVNPLQAAAIAEGVVGMIFGPMYPTPRCGPHDTPPPQPYRYQPGMPSYGQPRPYQPTSPSYAQPQPYQPQRLSDDDDDDGDYQVLQPRSDHRASNDSGQPQNRPALEDGSGQPVQADQSGYRSADGEDGGQQAQAAPSRPSHSHHEAQDTAT